MVSGQEYQSRLMYIHSDRPLRLLFILLIFSSSVSIGLTQHTWVNLFNGHDLEGWQTVSPEYQDLWYAQDSTIHGGDGITKIPANTYLYTSKEYKNFELRCLFRLTGDPTTGMINSGIQYRSFIEDGLMIGYQADIGEGFWGGLYDEHRRGQLVVGNTNKLNYVLQPGGWNSYTIRVEGNHHQLFINGVQTVDYYEKDPTIPEKGVIAVQNHSGGNSHVEFRFIKIIELP